MEENLQYQKMNNTKIFRGSDYDNFLSQTSENAVQNKVITKALNDKVEKELGKGLSENDFTNIYREKLDSIKIKHEEQIIGWTRITQDVEDEVDIRPQLALGYEKFTILVYLRKGNVRQGVKYELTSTELQKIGNKVNKNMVCITRSCINPNGDNSICTIKQCVTAMQDGNTNPIFGYMKIKYNLYDYLGTTINGLDNFEWCMYAE